MKKYYLYNSDKVVAEFLVDQGVIASFTPSVPELLPMQIRNTNAEGFTYWLSNRAIDINTVIHRNMVNELLGTRNKISLSILTHMFSISDTFTCFEEGTFVPRNNICDVDGQSIVSKYILLSSDTSLRRINIATPNVSTDGSFPKTWEYQDGAWWLYKLQSSTASRCEVEISKVLRECGWDAAEYRYDGSYRTRVKTKNFIGENEFFEPYDSYRYCFANKSDADEVIEQNIASLGDIFDFAWKRIELADAFFENTDRHIRNFGVIRSSLTGETLRLAPNFDNNQAFLANPGGRFSGMMLKYYMARSKGNTDDLKHLVEVTSRNAYLLKAAQNAKMLLDSH